MRTTSILECLGLGFLLVNMACIFGTDADDDSASASADSGDDGTSGSGMTASSATADPSAGESASDATDDGVDSTDDGAADTTGGGGPFEPIALVDCFTAESDEPRCKSNPDEGTIGMGPPIFGNDYVEVYGALIEGSTMYAAANMGSNADDIGGVLRIDLSTGDRTWISGNYQYDDEAVMAVGDGPDIGAIVGITRLSDDRVMIFRGGDSEIGAAFLELDLATGNRNDLIAPVMGDRFLCSDLETTMSDLTNLAPGDAGDFYAAGRPNGSGSAIVRFATDGSCTIVSWSDDSKGIEVGTGAPFGKSVDSLEYSGGLIYGLTGFGGRDLFVVDPTTGDRTLLSSDQQAVGVGPNLGEMSLDVADGKIWTAGYFDAILPLVSVDPATGDRTDEAALDLAGPFGKGLSDKRALIFAYGDQIVFETNGGGIGVFDPATGNSNWISM